MPGSHQSSLLNRSESVSQLGSESVSEWQALPIIGLGSDKNQYFHLEWEYAWFVGGGAAVSHTDLLCCLLEYSWEQKNNNRKIEMFDNFKKKNISSSSHFLKNETIEYLKKKDQYLFALVFWERWIFESCKFDKYWTNLILSNELSMKEMALVHCERNGNDKKNNLMMSRRKKQMRERKKGEKE